MDKLRQDRFTSKEGEMTITYPEKKKPKSTGNPSKPNRAKSGTPRKGSR